MRLKLIAGASIILAFVFPTALFAANPKPGSVCTKAGQTKVYAGNKYTCIKSGKKLVWNFGVHILTEDEKIRAAVDAMVEAELAKKNAEDQVKNEAVRLAEDNFIKVGIVDSSWSLTGILDGYFVNLSEINDISYQLTEIWESTKKDGIYYQVAVGVPSKISRTYFADLGTKWVKIRHVTKNGKTTAFSNLKSIKSVDPSGFDSTGPDNNSTIQVGTKTQKNFKSVLYSKDPFGQFNFDQMVSVSWDPSTDPSVTSYKVGFKVSSDTEFVFSTVKELVRPAYTWLGLAKGVKYDFVVFAQDIYGNTNKNPVAELNSITLNS